MICGASPCAVKGPIIGNDCSRRSRPDESRYSMAVDLWTIRFPSASVCVVSVTASAEYGDPFTGFPPTSMSETNPKLPLLTTFTPCAIIPAVIAPPGSCAYTDPTTANKIRPAIISLMLPSPSLFRYRFYKTDGSRQPFFTEQHISLYPIAKTLLVHRQSNHLHGRRGQFDP